MNIKYEDIVIETTQDPIWKEYFRNNAIYADFINGSCFNDKQVISANDLDSYDADASTLIMIGRTIRTLRNTRDIIRLWNHDKKSFIAIENQSIVDYSMTFRVMMYDFINYHQQYSLLKKNQRKNFRSIPIQTYVFYHGEEEWKAPHSLTDRMRIPAVFQKNINTWEIPIIDIKKLNSKNYKEKYNRKLIEGVQAYYEWKKDITKIPNLILSKYIAIIVATIVNDEVLLKFAKETKKEEIEMCIALKMFAEVNKNEGINEGIFQGKVLTLLKILKTKFNNLSEETVELINKSNDECLDRLTMQVAFIQKEDEVKILLQSKLV